MNRVLSDRERGVLTVMIEYGLDSTSSTPVTPADRHRWLTHVAGARVVGRCVCGTCPSVDLASSEDPAVPGGRHRSRVVLEASVPDAVLLLFIDDDELSYLELAPTDPDVPFAEFPPVDSIKFPALKAAP